jgi:hypothetical protein
MPRRANLDVTAGRRIFCGVFFPSRRAQTFELSTPVLMQRNPDAWTRFPRIAESFETAFSRSILASEERDGEFC